MRRIVSLSLTLILLLSVLLIPVSAAMVDVLSEEYYRAASLDGSLSDEEQKELDETFVTFAKRYRIDFCCFSTTTERYSETSGTLKKFAEEYFAKYGFGYGARRDGFVFAYDSAADTAALVAVNGAKTIFSEELLDGIAADARAQYSAGLAAMYRAAYKGLLDKLTGGGLSFEDSGIYFIENGKPTSDTLPDWYPTPEEIENFKPFHDPDAPRVVDKAGIFTDEEEKKMLERIKKVRDELNKDIVIFTDVSTYGMSKSLYAADFYDFNGYGFDDENSGMILMICMDPSSRGWWACATGEEVMAAYNQYYNDLDDQLYEYMSQGDYRVGAYGEGVYDWICNIERMYRKGDPFAPEWIPEDPDTFERKHDAEAPRVSDPEGILTEEQVNDLTAKAKKMSDEYGFDVVLHVTNQKCRMNYDEYCNKYYTYNGYGFGDNYDGMIFTLFLYEGTNRVAAFGKAEEKLQEGIQRSRLLDRTECGSAEDAYRSLDEFLTYYEMLLTRGRVPHGVGYWIFISLLALAIGAIVSAILTSRQERKMHTVKLAQDAKEYVVRGSEEIKQIADRYLHTSVSKTYSPVSKSSGSSSGGSSHHSSYSGSSGSSHSGSGRSF